MTSLLTKTALAAAATIITMTPALADRVDQRQHKQAQRIEQGVRSGQLTGYEARKLKAEQKKIAVTERKFERDGKLTRNERTYLNKQQNQAGRHIAAERRDHQQSWDRGYGWNHDHRRHSGFGSWMRRSYGWNYGYYPQPRRWW
jgi:hypothetical protein